MLVPHRTWDLHDEGIDVEAAGLHQVVWRKLWLTPGLPRSRENSIDLEPEEGMEGSVKCLGYQVQGGQGAVFQV